MSAAICTIDLASMWDREVDYQRLHGAATVTKADTPEAAMQRAHGGEAAGVH